MNTVAKLLRRNDEEKDRVKRSGAYQRTNTMSPTLRHADTPTSQHQVDRTKHLRIGSKFENGEGDFVFLS